MVILIEFSSAYRREESAPSRSHQSGLLCLKVGAALIETSDDDEDDRGSKHQPGEEGKVLIVADFMRGACHPKSIC